MDLYEYQAKHLFDSHGVPVTAGEVCATPDAAHEAARKIDPGELFPWDRLAQYKLCLPRPQCLAAGNPFHNLGSFFLALERFGYDITDQVKAVEAFERRWRPEHITGVPDGEIAAILWQLLLDRDQGRTR